MDGIFFDLDNTLIDRAAAFEGYLVGLSKRVPAVFQDSGARDRLREMDSAGYRPRPEFCRLAMEAFNPPWSTVAEVWQDFADGLTRAVTENPRVLELIRRLKQRYTLALVTNGGRRRQREKLVLAGLDRLFETVLISEEVGAEKPDREIFERALAETKVEADRALFVGDDPERDIVGASAAGLQTCWVSHGRTFPEWLPPPTFTITTVEELEDVL